MAKLAFVTSIPASRLEKKITLHQSNRGLVPQSARQGCRLLWVLGPRRCLSQIMPLPKRRQFQQEAAKKRSVFYLQAAVSSYAHHSAPGEKFLPPTLSVLHVDTGDRGFILETASREEKKLTDIMRSSP